MAPEAGVIDTSSAYDVDYDNLAVVNAWETRRLRFLRIDGGDEYIRQALIQTQQDPVVMALASSAALQPVGAKEMNDTIGAISNALLGVAIELLPEEADRQFPDRIKQFAPKPVVIGNMTIGWGGVSLRTVHHRNASMGITLAQPFQGKGYGTEAINWMLDWAFGHMGLHTVSLTAASYNQRGIGLYKKLGFRVEGRRKETIYFDRGWHDEIDFGMTEHEWEALRGRKKKKA